MKAVWWHRGQVHTGISQCQGTVLLLASLKLEKQRLLQDLHDFSLICPLIICLHFLTCRVSPCASLSSGGDTGTCPDFEVIQSFCALSDLAREPRGAWIALCCSPAMREVSGHCMQSRKMLSEAELRLASRSPTAEEGFGVWSWMLGGYKWEMKRITMSQQGALSSARVWSLLLSSHFSRISLSLLIALLLEHIGSKIWSAYSSCKCTKYQSPLSFLNFQHFLLIIYSLHFCDCIG